MRRLGWTATAPAGVQVSDRVRRVAEEAAARTLRQALYRREIINAMLATWPGGRRSDQEWGGAA